MSKENQENEKIIPTIINANDIRNMIYIIRDQQVMLDSDLAILYGYEVKRLNEQVKRNIARFPDDFMFRLTEDEVPESLRSQNATLNKSATRRGTHRKYLPYAFTEQGIYMLATVLKGEIAEKQSIYIMRAFREMRHFIANNALLFEKVSNIELKQLEYQKSTDERFDKVFQYIEDHAESSQKIFFDGQIYDAFSLMTSIIKKAENDIVLIDGYVDVNTLNILAKKKDGVNVNIYTYSGTKLTKKDIDNFNKQYPFLTVFKTQVFHDRFIIIDNTIAYHIGASIKDAGLKCFGISLLDDEILVNELIERLKAI